MEVKTVDETTFSLREILLYTAIAAAMVAVVFSPVLVFESYARVLNTLLLLALLGLVARTAFSTVLAFASPDTPPLPADADLPTVSILIPAYNEAPVLADTVEACRNLDYPTEKLEVILCYEAASVDGTCEIAEREAAGEEYIHAVERDEPGGGKAKATNYALRYATGEVVAGIDADHQFAPDAVRTAVAWFLADEDTWCVKGRCYGRNPTDSVLALHATVERHIAEKADIFAREVFDGFTFYGGGQAFFRAEVFEKLGLFDEEIMIEDIDMSSRIHAEGKDLHVDPSIITFEENPDTLEAWWSQRKRWARGWMQITNRYLRRLPRAEPLSAVQRADCLYTLAYGVVPALLVFAFPMGPLRELTGVSVETYLPVSDAVLWSLPMVVPAVVFAMIAVQDWRDGLSHHPAEFLGAATLGPYLIFQTLVFVVAFIQEYLLGKPSVYVTTSRSEG